MSKLLDTILKYKELALLKYKDKNSNGNYIYDSLSSYDSIIDRFVDLKPITSFDAVRFDSSNTMFTVIFTIVFPIPVMNNFTIEYEVDRDGVVDTLPGNVPTNDNNFTNYSNLLIIDTIDSNFMSIRARIKSVNGNYSNYSYIKEFVKSQNTLGFIEGEDTIILGSTELIESESTLIVLQI